VHYGSETHSAPDWLPEKDRPVLLAAIACHCDVLVTGDPTHFGPGFGRDFEGMKVVSPAQLALALWGGRQNAPRTGKLRREINEEEAACCAITKVSQET